MRSRKNRARDEARKLLTADAAFEVVLGGGLLGAAAVGRDLGVPAPRAALATFGGGLLPFAGALLAERRRPHRDRVKALAAVNGTTAAAFGAWLAARRRDFRAPGAALVGATAATLAALAASQARTATRL
jgi:hypothetical protein